MIKRANHLVNRPFRVKTYNEYRSFADRVLNRLVKEVEVDAEPSLSDILQKHKKLVCAQSHGPALGPVAYTLVMCRYFAQAGGGDRKPIAITHRMFYQMPLAKQFVTYITQVPKAVGFHEFLELFVSDDYNDLCLMPEGDHCNFGNGLDVMPFKSPKFVEIALRAKAPILIVAHAGGEIWGKEVGIPNAILDRVIPYLPDALVRPLSSSRSISLPFLVKPIEKLRIKIELFELPDVDLDVMSDQERSEVVVGLADEVRGKMQALVDELKRA